MFEVFWHLKDDSTNWTPNIQALLIFIWAFPQYFNSFVDIGFGTQIVHLKEFFNDLVALIKELMAQNLIFRLNISEPSKLIEMSSECIPGMLDGLISSTNKTSTFDHIMPSIESGGREVFIDGMDLKVSKWVDRGWAMLPNIPHYIVEVSGFEIVGRIGREPVLHIDIPNLFVIPVWLIFV